MLSVGWCRLHHSNWFWSLINIEENQEALYWGRAPRQIGWKKISRKLGGFFFFLELSLNYCKLSFTTGPKRTPVCDLTVFRHPNARSLFLWFWHLSLSRSAEESWWSLSKSAARAPLCSKHQKADQESALPFDKEWVADLPKALSLMVSVMMLIIQPHRQSVTWRKLLFYLSQKLLCVMYCIVGMDSWKRVPWMCIYIYNVLSLRFHYNKLVRLYQSEGNDSSWGKMPRCL